MRTTRTRSALALAGLIALGAAACGDDADPTGESGTEQMTEDMTEMTEDMTEMTEDMGEEMTDGEG